MVNHSRLGRTLKETYKRQSKHKVQTWRVPCFVSSFLGSVWHCFLKVDCPTAVEPGDSLEVESEAPTYPFGVRV